MKKIIQNALLYLVVFFTTILLGTLISSRILNVILAPSPQCMVDETVTKTPLAALKERCNSCFRENCTDDVCTDDFLNVIDTEDEAGNTQSFAVYYRQYKDWDTNVFLLVPDKETEQSWFSYLKKVRSKTAKEAELYQYNFSLQENTIWITSSSREA